jgi:hypothetical protein
MICTKDEYIHLLRLLQTELYNSFNEDLEHVQNVVFKQLRWRFSKSNRQEYLDNFYDTHPSLKLASKINQHFWGLYYRNPSTFIDLEESDCIFKQYVKARLTGKGLSDY